MSDGDCGDCDCGEDCCECGDCDCCECGEDCCECGDCDCCECGDSDCFGCSCCHCLHACYECCGGNDGCCGDNSPGHGCNWCICFLVADGVSEGHRRPHRRYELDRRRQIEVQVQSNSGSPPCAANGVNPAHPPLSTTNKKRTAKDQKSEIRKRSDNEENSPPAVITTQPPSYDEVIHRDNVVTAQPV
ncbi:uncharacterized protein LOC133194925 [Saccostrea echinata]|uniref:uncharacterized protein LOC133194925 n=1 Tax=Saccostrea echinata TaxID=191078 RepID=UPI002A8124C4|nr:uncharacterized protein LOC133194925 [Saccostrea echinata]